MMPSGEACDHAATFISTHLQLLSEEQLYASIANMVLGEQKNQSLKITHITLRIHISSTFLNQISHHVQMSIG
jgi:hypothetical protein